MKKTFYVMSALFLLINSSAFAQNSNQTSSQTKNPSENGQNQNSDESEYQNFKKQFSEFSSFDELDKNGLTIEASNPKNKDSKTDCPSHIKLENQGPFAVLTVDDEQWLLTQDSLKLPAHADDFSSNNMNYIQKFRKGVAIARVDYIGNGTDDSWIVYITPGSSTILVQIGASPGNLSSDGQNDTCVLNRVNSNPAQVATQNTKNVDAEVKIGSPAPVKQPVAAAAK